RDVHPDAAADDGTFLDAEAGGRDVAGDLRRPLEDHGFAAAQAALDRAADGHASSAHVAADAGLLADRHVTGDLHVALDAAVNFKRALATDVAANDGARTNNGTFGHLLLYDFSKFSG